MPQQAPQTENNLTTGLRRFHPAAGNPSDDGCGKTLMHAEP
jgi:hypothetical protein